MSMAAVELFAWFAGVPAIASAGPTSWLTLPRDLATIGTAVALSALFGYHVRRNAEERTRGVRLETLLWRADAGTARRT
jgi:hypothetical protein